MPKHYRQTPWGRGWPSTKLILVWGLCLFCVLPFRARGAPSEYTVKAAFLFNFAQFIQWPAATFSSPRDNIVLGVLGDDDFPPDLQSISGRSVPGRGQNRLIILKRLTSAADISQCQILFILHSARASLPAVMRAVGARSILTVLDDAPDFAQAGAVINLYKTSDQRIRFEINVDAAKRADLTIDSPLLNLAKMVRTH